MLIEIKRYTQVLRKIDVILVLHAIAARRWCAVRLMLRTDLWIIIGAW